MDYIQEIRGLVGSRPLILVATSVLALDEKNRLLMQLRSDTHTWGLIGGYMEMGESPEACATRELAEETGLTCGDLQFHSVMSGPDMFMEYPNGDQVYPVLLVFIARDLRGTLQTDTEGLDLRFFDLNHLPDTVFGNNRKVLQRVFPELVP